MGLGRADIVRRFPDRVTVVNDRSVDTEILDSADTNCSRRMTYSDSSRQPMSASIDMGMWISLFSCLFFQCVHISADLNICWCPIWP